MVSFVGDIVLSWENILSWPFKRSLIFVEFENSRFSNTTNPKYEAMLSPSFTFWGFQTHFTWRMALFVSHGLNKGEISKLGILESLFFRSIF